MRINILPIETLSNVHLRAEFREIIMSIHYYKRSSRSKNGIDESRISKRYTLNGVMLTFGITSTDISWIDIGSSEMR